MFFAFKLSDIITVPFGWILKQLYHLLGNYGLALVIFAVIVNVVMIPITAKSKKSMMKMSRLQPRLQDIQRRYANDQQKQNELMTQLYRDEGVSMGGGCLWSLVPLLILWPLFTVIREPIHYILGASPEVANQIVTTLQTAAPELFGANTYYAQVTAAQLLPQFTTEIQAAIPSIDPAILEGINFQFLGLNMGAIPSFSFWSWEAYDWAHVGLFLIPLLSVGAQLLQTWIMQKTNESVITDQNGVQDSETAKNSQAAQTNKTMMIMMPFMTLWIGYSAAAGLSVYWLIGGIIRTISDVILTQRYRKIYDAEDALRLQRAMERDAIEAEKERVRAERRAANPEGQTQNTSKKKLQRAEAAKTAAERAEAQREYNAKRGIVEEEPERETLSGIADRPYCKGRAYDPDRYSR